MIAELDMVRAAGRVPDTIVVIPTKAEVADVISSVKLADFATALFGNSSRSRKQVGSESQHTGSEIGIPEFFSAEHPLLQGPYLKVARYAEGEEGAHARAQVTSITKVRFSQIAGLSPAKRLENYVDPRRRRRWSATAMTK